MELDDVAEKARRNLMMASTGILAVWALGIPLDGKLVGAVNLSTVEPWRAWATVTAVLLYFSLRHYFAPPTLKEWQGWTDRRKKWFFEERHRILDRCLPFEALVENAQLALKDNRMTFGNLGIPADQIWVSTRKTNVIWKKHKGQMEVLWDKHPGRVVTTLRGEGADHKSTVQFAMRRRTYIWLVGKSWAHAYRLSWRLLELTFPWILAFAAAIVCLCKLATSLYYSFPFVRQLLSI